jgi:Ca-activated chloride channel homolog
LHHEEAKSLSGVTIVHQKAINNGPVKVDVDLVLVPITVTDQKDRMAIGLQKDSFDILDQNKS